MDIAVRAHLGGWKFIYLNDVKTFEQIYSWALFSSLFGSGLLGRNPVNMHYHWLLPSDGESEVPVDQPQVTYCVVSKQ
ncbi:hypothetical protein Syun_009590 [Stephania yunnanensis]|uniref:Uncharacterized protein n=1 Tax=Stephania yunnanensis TaxID=152371 RepID=A0AAP0KEQ8_9MAGN